jgi:putative membrane protein
MGSERNRRWFWRLTARWAASAGALWVASLAVPGIDFQGWEAVLVAAGIFTGVGLVVRPVAMRLSFPVQCLTLGLFTWVVSAGMLALTAWLSGQVGVGFGVDGVIAAFVGAPLVGIVSFFFERVLR